MADIFIILEVGNCTAPLGNSQQFTSIISTSHNFYIFKYSPISLYLQQVGNE